MKQLLRTPPLWHPLLLITILTGNVHLILHMTRRQLALRYKGSVLGWLWSLVQPLMMLVVYAFVFGIVFKARWGAMPDGGSVSFAAVMFCGMATFNLFSETVNGAAPVILQNANLVKKVVFPLEILPAVQLASAVILSSVWFLLLFIGAAALGISFHGSMFLLPVLLLPVLLLSLGVAYFVAAASVYVRDMPHLAGVVTQILFFLTPIFYPVELVPEQLRWVLKLNPLSSMVEEVRGATLFGQWPDWSAFIWNLLIALIVCRLGLCWFLKTKKGFADVL
ncbi:ABC transporter permease [uncultured Desulfovibrio sp.]|uniref:ABC transporter permease n=1 Tax=uncultured Desulfovibrio sp. TaxID=167968 RepID=UPI002628F03E|nr:ABC transporter permease [uncultured Desulfovibrio sp.]